MTDVQHVCPLDTGDRVRAAAGLGRGFFRPTVAAGEPGIVFELGRAGTYQVYFTRSRVRLWVSGEEIAAMDPLTLPLSVRADQITASQELLRQTPSRAIALVRGVDGGVREVPRNRRQGSGAG